MEKLVMENPVIQGIGATNRPHVQYLDEITFMENGDIKIPLLLLGLWKYGDVVLEFTEDVIGKFVAAFESGTLGHKLSMDCRHLPKLGALAWIREFILELRDDGKRQFSAIGKTTPSGEQLLRGEEFKYASVEFVPNFGSRLVAAFGMETDEPGLFFQEVTMPEQKNEGTISLEEFKQLQDVLNQAKADVVALQAQSAEVAKKDQRIVTLERALYGQQVTAAVLEAEKYRDGEKKAHSKVFLEWMDHVLRHEPVGEGDGAIVLEEGSDVGRTNEYYRKSIVWLSKVLPGQVPTQIQTAPQKDPTVGNADAIVLSEEDDAEIGMAWRAV